jgi:hypothetical protein
MQPGPVPAAAAEAPSGARGRLRWLGCRGEDARSRRHLGVCTAKLDRELPWPDKVRFISALEVLKHMIDTDGFLKRAFDALLPGGWLVISTPNINSLRNRIMVPLGVYPVGLEYRTVVHHVRLYNVPTLRGHLRAMGFGRMEIRGVAFLPLNSSVGRGGLSTWLADSFPSLCGNLIAAAQKPPLSGQSAR